jgi:biotin transport system substrate-specific component
MPHSRRGPEAPQADTIVLLRGSKTPIKKLAEQITGHSTMNTPNLTLMGHIWPASSPTAALLRAILLTVLGSLFVAAAAQVSVPMLPVPMTLQTLAVLVIGGAYGWRLGIATLALYALEGAAGLPVFAEMKAGLPVLMGPTGGYILGFILAAGLVGYLAEKGWDRNAFTMLGATLMGAAVLYVPGLAWLYTFMGGIQETVAAGLYPFIPGDVIKAILAAIAFPATWLAVHRR